MRVSGYVAASLAVAASSAVVAALVLDRGGALREPQGAPSTSRGGKPPGGRPPSSVAELNREANRLAALARYDEAMALLGRALEMDPASAPTHYNRGRIFHLTGERDKALGEYDLAISFRPDYPRALTNRAILVAARGETARAVADLTRAIELEPGRTPAWYHRGRLRLRLGEYRAALADLDHVLRLDPGDEKARELREKASEGLRPGAQGESGSPGPRQP